MLLKPGILKKLSLLAVSVVTNVNGILNALTSGREVGSDKLWNIFLHRIKTVDFVSRYFHWKRAGKASLQDLICNHLLTYCH